LKKASQKLSQRKDENRALFEKSFAKTSKQKTGKGEVLSAPCLFVCGYVR
jgi:hypothetical protein